MVVLQLPPDEARRLLPASHAPAQVERLLPGGRGVQEAGEVHAACVAPPHHGPGEGALQERVEPRQHQRQRGGGEGQGDALDHRLLALEGEQGAVVDALAELPGAPALVPELVDEQIPPHGRDGAHGV